MNNYHLAPVLLFVYKRLKTLKLTIESLQKNNLANESELIIFSDGAKFERDEQEIREIREYLKTVDGFKKIRIFESANNKGLANSIIDGVSIIVSDYGKVIVLEDDLITSPSFLSFMNQCLDYYLNDDKMFSVSGFSFPLKEINKDVYFTKRASSWGWATWKDRWEPIDWQVSDYNNFKNNAAAKKAFNSMGSDLTLMLKNQLDGKMNSWAIRWVYHQFRKDMFTVYPTVSKVRNIGFGKGATHTFDYFNRYETILDESGKQTFNLLPPYLDKKILKIFLNKFSFFTRVKYKIFNMLAAMLLKANKNA